MRYRAFISYSHNDSRAARWLHRSLEGYRVPSRLRGSSGEFGLLPDLLSPIFRDREDLASAGELGPKIQAALNDSEALIVICSPDAARSPWVNGEILKFKRTGRANRIYCLIVAGEPNTGDARECFAPALRFDLDANGELGTQPAEPIAADIRPGKDGNALARLKLLSGLLGVPLDTLRQREAARAKRRMLAITALAVVVMLVTSYLAVQAVIARNAAERRQKQAEALVDFMLGDLTDKLAQVSRLDILESVDNRAMEYFQSLPTADITDQALEQRAKALMKIGNVRLDQGHLPQALQTFETAAVLASRLAKEAPGNIDRQLAYADILTSIGTAHWYKGELDQAQQGFSSAQSVLRQARMHARDNTDVLFQLTTLANNIGHVLESRGKLDEAMLQYRNMLESSENLSIVDPGHADWQTYLGLAHNNLAKMALLHGDLPTAVSEYRADLGIEIALGQHDQKDNNQTENIVLSSGALGRTLALTGEIDAGMRQLELTLKLAGQLREVDAQNTGYQYEYGLYATQMARLKRLAGDFDEASALSAKSRSLSRALTHQDPSNVGWQRGTAEAAIEQAAQSREVGNLADSREQVRAALSILEPQLEQSPYDRATVLDTLTAKLLLASVTDVSSQASMLREQVLHVATTQASGRDDPRLLALNIEALLALDRKPEAMMILPALWKTGYRDLSFITLLKREKIATPNRP